METQQQNQPTTIKDQFIVKVKLLSNEVYDFVIEPETTKVSDLKQMILEKINVPIQRQRIVFGGKQLVDQNKVSDYVKESGLTVHLIAKSAVQNQPTNPTTNTTNQNTTQSQPNRNIQQQNRPQNTQHNTSNSNNTNPSNPFANIMSMVGGMVGGPQGATMTFTNMGDMNQGLGGLGSLGGLLGSLGIRIPTGQSGPTVHSHNNHDHTHQHNNPYQTPPTNRPQPQQQTNQATSTFNPNINTNTTTTNTTNTTNNVPPPPQNPQSVNQITNPTVFNVSNNPILRLNQTISTLNLPSQPVLDNSHLSLRQQTAQYLRRLQHQYMRLIPQLNRSVQLLNQGRVSHMGQVLKLFQAMDGANQHAQQAIRKLINLPANSQQQQQQASQNNNNQSSQSSLVNNLGGISLQSNILSSLLGQNMPSSTTSTNSQQQPQNIQSTTLPSQQTSSSNQPIISQHRPQQNTIVQVQMMQQQGDYNSQDDDQMGANVQATIIIQQNDILDADIDDQPTNFNTNRQNNGNPRIINAGTTSISLSGADLENFLGSLTGQSNGGQSNGQGGLGGLGSILSMFGGGNTGLGMGLNMRQGSSNSNNSNNANTSTTQNQTGQNSNTSNTATNNSFRTQQQPQQNQNSSNIPNTTNPTNVNQNANNPSTQPPPPPMQMPFNIGNLASMASMMFAPQQQQTQTSTSLNETSSESQPTPRPNPFGNLMGIFNSIQQSGSMGELMNMSIGDMLQQGTQQSSIYSNLFRSIVGSDLISCFTTKNFDFLDRKYDEMRQDFLQAIAFAGSQEDLVDTVTRDLSGLIVPPTNISDRQQCLSEVRKMIRKYVAEVARITMNRGDSKYSQKAIQNLKQAFCQAISFVASRTQNLPQGQTPQQFVFSSIKTNSIAIMNQFIQGLSGMFYSFIQRDLIRVYTQYKQQKKRKNQRSQQQIASQQDLLKQIEQQSKKDIEYLTNFQHSQFYHPAK